MDYVKIVGIITLQRRCTRWGEREQSCPLQSQWALALKTCSSARKWLMKLQIHCITVMRN